MAMAAKNVSRKLLASATSTSSSSVAHVSTSGGLGRRADGSGRPTDVVSMKKGPGYRSSFSGDVVTVFGSTGAIARVVCNKLGKSGAQMVIPYHGEHYNYMRLKVCGDLGQVVFTPYHMRDEESIRLALKHSNVCINLAGSNYETRNFSFNDINVEAPARLARICKEMGVETFINISSINAREKPNKAFLPNGSRWLSTKWEGEQRVFEEFPDATIFRPTDVYGGSAFFLGNLFSRFRSGFDRRMPLWKKGESTVKAPVHISDIAQGIFNSIGNPEAKGNIYEAFGPERFLMSELCDYLHNKTRRDEIEYEYRRTDLRFAPYAFGKIMASHYLPLGQKWMGSVNADTVERMSISDEILGLDDLTDLGVKLAPLAEKMPYELEPYKKFAHYYCERLKDELPAPLPRPLNRVEERAVLAEERSGGMMQVLGLN